MKSACDYQIFQQNAQGRALVPFYGVIPAEHSGKVIWARALREDDTLDVTGWRRCAVDGDKWRIDFDLPAGGLYWLEARAQEEGGAVEWGIRIARVSHIGVGELFILAGQSNMAGYARDAAFDPPELGVHLYGNDGKWSVAAHPLNDSVDTIYPENAEYASNTSPALSFARMMKHRLGVPVGIVQASMGGSPLSRWQPEEDGDLYRAMLRRLDAVGSVGTMLWYQGCTDANDASSAPTYYERFRRAVEIWRRDMGNIRIVTVQLNRSNQPLPYEARDRRWGMVREAQRRAAREIPNLIVVPASDLSCTDWIHNSSGSNVILGERMAHAALKAFYDQAGMSAPDIVRAVRVDATHVRMEFEPGRIMRGPDNQDSGIDVEDARGLHRCTKSETCENGLIMTVGEPFELPAQLHAYWRVEMPAFITRDLSGMPMLSCYGVKVESEG